MIKIKKGMSALVVGLGKSGVSVTKLLCKKGIKVTVTDERNKTDLRESLEALEGFKFKSELGKHVLKTFCDQDFIVLSPGVSPEIKPLQQAIKMKVPVLSEVEVAAQFITTPVIAVTGTNGKTTTAHLIQQMLEAGGKTVFLGGSLGIPLSEYPIQRGKADFVVAELSSFQLEHTYSLKPTVAVYMNVAPDHLDRYPTFDDYVNAKLRLHALMDENDHVVVNLRDSKLMQALSGAKPKTLFFTSNSLRETPTPFVEKFQGMFLDPVSQAHLKTTRWKDHTFELTGVKLRGLHNKENMMAATLAAKLAGVSNEAIQKVLLNFEPLPHRMEYVGRKNRVDFYNDSKGTNLHSLMRSLESFDEPVILIAGGKDKGEDYGQLAGAIRRRVKNLILIGEAKEKINRAVGDFSETFLVGTFEEAIYVAYQKSRSGDVVLLSPGCSGQDMFPTIEDRGDHFKKIIGMFR